MPILDVEVVVAPGEVLSPDLAARLADRAGAALHAAAGRTWVSVRALPLAQYAESGGGPEPGVEPVFVTVIRASRAAGEAMEVEAGALTSAIAEACGRPAENVHLIYEPDAVGRVAFGGKVVRG
jgi:phenylpyruvate tautomerase PptA (4-oxalocrotonate tautomerase family)